MKTIEGDIWHLSTKHDAIVVTANVGWKKSGLGVLGAGLARDAARRFPWLAKAWGAFCQAEREDAVPASWRVDSKWCRYLVMFPTKALDPEAPWASWRADSSWNFIEGQLKYLVALAYMFEDYAVKHEEPTPRVLVPSLGCGHGGLHEEVVVPAMARHLIHSAFVHVRRPT